MANFFELLGFDSNDMADAMPEKIVQVGTCWLYFGSCDADGMLLLAVELCSSSQQAISCQMLWLISVHVTRGCFWHEVGGQKVAAADVAAQMQPAAFCTGLP
jgi:hypothetical protein